MKLTDPKVIKNIMQADSLRFNKNLGQNFLVDEGVLTHIITGSGADKECGVIEIGPGLGTLTQVLAEAAAKVVSVELDRSIAAYLKKSFAAYSNVEIIEGDFLKQDVDEIIEEKLQNLRVLVIANLPYYITTPIIMRLLEGRSAIESITVMVQKEVAERLCASPGTKAYGAISVAVQYYSDAEIIVNVPKECFLPAPKVDSAVIKLDIKGHTKPEVYDEEMFFKVVKGAFAQRRKTLTNSLTTQFELPKEQIRDIVEKVCNNANIRGEALSISDFAQITKEMLANA